MADADTDLPVNKSSVRWLLLYLIAATVVSGFAFVTLWSAQPQTNTPPVPVCTGAVPKLTNMFPDRVAVGTAIDILAIGCNFPPIAGTTLTINGNPHALQSGDTGKMRISLSSADVATAGTLTLAFTSGGTAFATGKFEVVQPAMNGGCPLTGCLVGCTVLWWGPWFITVDVQLLLLVMVSGIFGSSVYALKSLADYRGENKLKNSWMMFYWIQPPEGAGIALMIYLVVRGGFLSANADVKSVNQFGICAIAVMAGAFSDIAFMKLQEVFKALFSPKDDRKDKIDHDLKITTTSLPDGIAGTAYHQTLQATGGVAPLSWAVAPPMPPDLTLDKSGTISGTPTAPSPKKTYKITVTDSSTTPVRTTADLDLTIGPVITTASLPQGKVGSPYADTLSSSGLKGAITWSVNPTLPAGLSLNPATGAISGTPTAASPNTQYQFTAKDAAGTTAGPASLSLEIK
jgi:hypothetical protein